MLRAADYVTVSLAALYSTKLRRVKAKAGPLYSIGVEQIETWCEGLARRGQWLQSRGHSVWPDETVSGRYGFIHALYHEVVYHRIPAAQRLRWHRCIGARLAAGYGEQARDLAAELAMHFTQGREYQQAIAYGLQAANNALRRSAYREAITHLRTGLTLLHRLPDTTARWQQELALQITLGSALMATRGMAAPEVEQTYGRARQLCLQAGKTSQHLQILFGLLQCYLVQGKVPRARELGEQFFALAKSQDNPASLLAAHWLLGVTLFYLGEFTAARAHVEQGMALYNVQHTPRIHSCAGKTPAVVSSAMRLRCCGCLAILTRPNS